jgi:hypothetical protein
MGRVLAGFAALTDERARKIRRAKTVRSGARFAPGHDA